MSESAENRGDSLHVEQLFEAITSKDEQALASALQHSTIETILKFKLRYGHTPLAYCCTPPSVAVTRLGLVRCLLTSAGGLGDSEMIVEDGAGHTVLGSVAARAHHDRSALALLEHIVQIVTDGADGATACYRMLKHNSLPLFQLFLTIKQYTEAQLFESLAWAVTKLNVKRAQLSNDLRMFVMWMMADYGYRRLSSSSSSPRKRADEWKDHAAAVGDCWRVIATKYDTGMYADVDDRLLDRLHVAHNHLYFLQHKPFLEHLPLREAIFCVALFINLYECYPKYEVYRFTVHKRLVVDAVRMLSFQLALAKQRLASTELELVALIQAGEWFVAERKNRMAAELVQRFELFGMTDQRPSGSKDTVLASMIQRLSKVDSRWAEAKLRELKAIRKMHRDRLIELLESRLAHVPHPQNVADRVLARAKRAGAIDAAFVADIVASERLDLGHLMRGKDRRIRRKLTKCYGTAKQLHSLDKIATTFARVATVDPTDREVFRDCLKRAVTVLGETMKSTNSTPNMPNARLKEAMEQILTERLADTVIFHRNHYAHEFSLPKLLVDRELERSVYSVLPHHTAVIRMAINLLLVIVLAEARRSFYGALVRCGSLEQLRSLLTFAGVKDVVSEMQNKALLEVRKHFANASALFADLRKGSVGRSPQFAVCEQQFQVQCSIVKQLEAMVASETVDGLNFESLRKTCFSCNCMATIRRLLHWKIDTCPSPNRLLETICTRWDPCIASLSHVRWLEPRLTWIDPTPVASKLAMLQGALVSATESHYLAHTRDLIEQLVAGRRHSAHKLEEHAVHQLNEALRPYYENIFFLDSKWKVLEAFWRQWQLPWDTAHVRTLRRADQQRLQTLFDVRRAKLRTILERNDLRTVDVLHVGLTVLHETILASLEHLQLELCEMLTAVGYFGDSFHYVKHRIPMIQGKNYRNLLAHDALSYNLLTDSGDATLIVNAYIFANTEVRLFDSGRTKERAVEFLRFPSLKDTTSWVEEQQQLLAAFKSNDRKQWERLIRSTGGSKLRSLFCSSPNVNHQPASCLPIVYHAQGIAALDPSISAYLSLYIAHYQALQSDPKYLLEGAVVRREFEAAIKLLDVREPFPRQEFYSWPELMSHPSSKAILTQAALNGRETLHQLLDCGNETCFAQMLAYLCEDDVYVATEEFQAVVFKAAVRGLRSSFALSVRTAHQLGASALGWTILLHWNDLLCNVAAKTELDDGRVYRSLLLPAIKANNDTALVYLLPHVERRYGSDALRECYQTASSLGRCSALRHLLDAFPPSTLDPSVLVTAIHAAALSNRWQCVRLLLDTGAPVDVFMPGYRDVETNVLLQLVLYDQVALIQQVRTCDRTIYGTLAEHPLAIALRAETASSRMVRALGALGFRWLDSATTLHEAIAHGQEQSGWNVVWQAMDDQLAVAAAAASSDPSSRYVSVLQCWKLIAFVEECTVLDGTNALCCAAQTGDSQMLDTLLDRACSMRRIDGVGVLHDITFLVDSTIVGPWQTKKNDQWSAVSCCDDLIGRIIHSTADGKMPLKEYTVDVGAICLKFIVPADVKVQDLHAGVAGFRDSSSSVDNLYDLRNITDSLFASAPQTMVYVTFAKGSTRSAHFLRIGRVCCLYTVVHTAGSGAVDLTTTLNASAEADGKTVLQLAIAAGCEETLVRRLVRMGANPLLADSYGDTPIHAALDHPARTLALYLMDECLERQLLNADGVGLEDVTDGLGHNTLLHTAVIGGNQAVVGRLLQLADRRPKTTTSRNLFGQTPAHTAAAVPHINTLSLMKQLLDYDRTPVDMEDVRGVTLLQMAAQADSIAMLDLIMEYEPNLTLQANRIALYEAIKRHHARWAKRFLEHVIGKGVREGTRWTQDEGADPVIMSLHCEDFALSRALLEYELGHRLEDITVDDRPRIETVLKASTGMMAQASNNFLTFLRHLLEIHATAGYGNC
uniref:ANK_REP_REGION domain-containing protein n=1 Tax=Anopheles stephensi TaxID=30069 RepID=A0A182Y192_ANOST